MIMFLSLREDLGVAAQHHPAKLSPIFVVTIGNEGDSGVGHDVAQSLQWPRRSLFRLLVDRNIEVRTLNGEAYRNDMRSALGIGTRQSPHPLRGQKCDLLV